MKPENEAPALAILLAGFLQREAEEARLVWDRSSGVLCLWPLTPLGVEPVLPDSD